MRYNNIEYIAGMLPVVSMREGQDGARVGGLLSQRREDCELRRSAQEFGCALEYGAFHL